MKKQMNGMLDGLSMHVQMMEASGVDVSIIRKWIADTKMMIENQKNSLSLEEKFSMLDEFSRAYGVDNSNGLEHFQEDDKEAQSKRAFRFYIMREELEEYMMAKDLTEVADALADQMYILIGTIMTHGLQDIFEDIFKEVHRSNMSKLGADGKPIYREDGKVLKGPNYFPPDIRSIIAKHTEDAYTN